MSFDKKNHDRLNEFMEQLPIISEPQNASHPIETETDPKALFRELMKASTDGKVPPHLLNRLKDIEANQLHQDESKAPDTPNSSINPTNKPLKGSGSSSPLIKKQLNKKDGNDSLYTLFYRLLLEEEDN